MILDRTKKKNDSPSIFSEDFPLWPAHKFDFAFDNSPWPLAMHSTAPSELKRRVASALISYFMRLKSVDYTLKTYTDKTDYNEGNPERLDLRIISQIAASMELVSETILRISEVKTKRLGETIGEWTMFRAPFGMEILISCANRGALFESLTIARMLLEQLAWAFAAIFEKDDERVAKINAQSSMRFLKTMVPTSGRFYGWLSDHAHWNYDAHVKGITIDEGRLGHIFASAHFKAITMCAALVLTSIYLRSVDELMRSSEEPEVLEHSLRQKLNEAERQNNSLIHRVVNIKPSDGDLASLATVIL